jgi:hypothetical protein
MSERPAALDKLPSRPLTVAEGRRLDAQESDKSWIRPESIILRGDDQVVVALMAINRESSRAWLLGFSPESERWLVVDEWEREDLDQESFYELLERWEADTFGGREEYRLG